MYVGWKTWGDNRNAVFSPRTRWVPESARWLIANGKVKQAHKHLLRCARMNGRKDFTISPEVRNWRSGHVLPPTFSLSLCFTSTLYLKWCSACRVIRGTLWSTGCLRPFCSRKHLHSLLKRKLTLSSRKTRNQLQYVGSLSIHHCHSKTPHCTGHWTLDLVCSERSTAWKNKELALANADFARTLSATWDM